MIYDPKYVGRMFKQFRNTMGMTQKQVAEKISISSSYYQSVENGSRIPSLSVFIDILNVFHISADAVLAPEPSSSNSCYDQITQILNDCSEKECQLVLSLTNAVVSNRE